MMAQISVLVARGGEWQTDMHMAYFAALALLTVYADWVVILAAAATVAVHHLSLNYLIPLAVFSNSASLSRVVLHAVILILEAGTLIWMIISLNNIFAVSNRSRIAAEDAAEEAQASSRAAEEARRSQQAKEMQQRRGEEALQRERELVTKSIGAGLSRLSSGDLSFRMVDDVPAAYRELRADFNAAIGQLDATMGTVTSGAGSIHASINLISASAMEFSRRSEKQAASIEETSGALAEITTTIKNTANNAAFASDIVQTTKGDATESGAMIRKAVDAIGRIEKSSQSISKIISVIDEIAFQTNLLALNAGVEAARAGESGKGFAVVASEVRALAQRSAEAAREIKGLISTSSAEVGQGVELVAQTVSALEKIVVQIVEIDRVVAEIAENSKDQRRAWRM